MLGIVISLISNLAALLIAGRVISGFLVASDWVSIGVVVVLLTIANHLALPVLRTILKPLVWLTFGLLGFILNGLLIYGVDKLSTGITINGIVPLILATIVIGAVNATISYVTKIFK